MDNAAQYRTFLHEVKQVVKCGWPPWQDWFILAMQGTEDKEGEVYQASEHSIG
jgi:hypothetical protein